MKSQYVRQLQNLLQGDLGRFFLGKTFFELNKMDSYICPDGFAEHLSDFYSACDTVCPPVAELAPRKFGQLFYGRQPGPSWSDF